MISDVSPLQGKTISMMYDEYGKDEKGNRYEYGAIGPNVLKILKEIGWEISEPPENIFKFYENPIQTINVMSDAKLNYIINISNILIISIVFILYNYLSF